MNKIETQLLLPEWTTVNMDIILHNQFKTITNDQLHFNIIRVCMYSHYANILSGINLFHEWDAFSISKQNRTIEDNVMEGNFVSRHVCFNLHFKSSKICHLKNITRTVKFVTDEIEKIALIKNMLMIPIKILMTQCSIPSEKDIYTNNYLHPDNYPLPTKSGSYGEIPWQITLNKALNRIERTARATARVGIYHIPSKHITTVGSGLIVNGGYVLTASHIIWDPTEHKSCINHIEVFDDEYLRIVMFLKTRESCQSGIQPARDIHGTYFPKMWLYKTTNIRRILNGRGVHVIYLEFDHEDQAILLAPCNPSTWKAEWKYQLGRGKWENNTFIHDIPHDQPAGEESNDSLCLRIIDTIKTSRKITSRTTTGQEIVIHYRDVEWNGMSSFNLGLNVAFDLIKKESDAWKTMMRDISYISCDETRLMMNQIILDSFISKSMKEVHLQSNQLLISNDCLVHMLGFPKDSPYLRLEMGYVHNKKDHQIAISGRAKSGMSGGPAVDYMGNVIGFNSTITVNVPHVTFITSCVSMINSITSIIEEVAAIDIREDEISNIEGHKIQV